MESSFRRLLSLIEGEREKIRSNWQQINHERETIDGELARLRQDTEEWCLAERTKIDNEWKRLDRLRERMSIMWHAETADMLEINCSGFFCSVPRSALCNVEGSYLNHMFSDAFIQSIPKDAQGRFFLDFNPTCFAVVVEFLQRRLRRPDAPPPLVPPEQQQNMDLLAEALKLKAFMRTNAISSPQGTSLRVEGDVIQATHSGWQLISARFPLWMAGNAYFEVRVVGNPDAAKGGLAVGICGHVPTGHEVHSIRLAHAALYVSGNGLVGTDVASHNVEKGIPFSEGSLLGVKHDIKTRALHWYHNRICIGSCSIKAEMMEHMRVLFPVFGLYMPDQKIQVDFTAATPRGPGEVEEFGGG
jgi:hypothetical protein